MLEDKDPDNVIKNNFATDYLGLNQENQRLRKENFELRNLPELVEKMLEGNLSESELQKKENQVAILKNEKNDLTAQLRNKDKIIKAWEEKQGKGIMISVLTIFLVAVSSYFLGKFQPKKK